MEASALEQQLNGVRAERNHWFVTASRLKGERKSALANVERCNALDMLLTQQITQLRAEEAERKSHEDSGVPAATDSG